MWPFRAKPKPAPPRVVDLENRLGDVETAIEWLRKSVRDLNARVTGLQRKKESLQDAPGATIEEGADTQVPPPQAGRQPPSTAHLARRFKGG